MAVQNKSKTNKTGNLFLAQLIDTNLSTFLLLLLRNEEEKRS